MSRQEARGNKKKPMRNIAKASLILTEKILKESGEVAPAKIERKRKKKQKRKRKQTNQD